MLCFIIFRFVSVRIWYSKICMYIVRCEIKDLKSYTTSNIFTSGNVADIKMSTLSPRHRKQIWSLKGPQFTMILMNLINFLSIWGKLEYHRQKCLYQCKYFCLDSSSSTVSSLHIHNAQTEGTQHILPIHSRAKC